MTVPLNDFFKGKIVALNHSEAFNELTGFFFCLRKD